MNLPAIVPAVSRRYPHLTVTLRGQWGGGGKDESGYDDMDGARDISRNDATRDSPRLFVQSEEVCRYKYNAFLSHRARAICYRWLTRWHLKSSILGAFSRRKDTDFNELEPPSFIIRSVRTRRRIRARFRVVRSTDRRSVCPEFLFQTNGTPVDRDRVCFSSGPLPSVTNDIRVQRTGKYIERRRSSV